MRPKKTRWLACLPGERCFRPQGKNPAELAGVILSMDEYEVMRLLHLEKMTQDAVARQMQIHRTTVSRILTSAHHKVTDALVNFKAIKVEKGCCQTQKSQNRNGAINI